MFELCATKFFVFWEEYQPPLCYTGCTTTRGNDMAKKVYEVEFKGQAQKFQFESKQQAEDFATIQAVFGGKQYRIQAIIVKEEVAK